MSMNYRLSSELYGNNLWMIDPMSFGSMWDILTDIRNGVKYTQEGEKLNNSILLEVPSSRGIGEHDLIHVVNLNGVITKNGGMSTNGTKQLANEIRTADRNNKVKGHLIVAASGGGAGNAIKTLTDAIHSANKPVGTWIENGEMACSACYGIISASDFIMAEDKDVVVGSLGTMISLSGRPKSSKDDKGQLHVRFYATKSTQKNSYYEQAMEGNGKPIIEHVLDPANETFLNNIKQNRPLIDEKTQMDGSIFKAGDVLGSMVDEIGSFQDAVNKVLSLANDGENNNNNSTKNKQMTKAELKNAHPDVYNAIVNEGVLAERDRVGMWMAHVNTDKDAVVNGIESGETLSNTQREKFLVKANSMNKIESLKNESADDLTPPESKTLDQIKNEELVKEEKEAFNFELN